MVLIRSDAKVEELGGIEMILEAMKNHPESAALQGEACKALRCCRSTGEDFHNNQSQIMLTASDAIRAKIVNLGSTLR